MEELEYGEFVAKIDPVHGANCLSLRHRGLHAQILREPPSGRSPDNPYLYGMPVLFPVNRVSGGRFVFEGREYVFPVNEPETGCHLHGMLHCTPFTEKKRTENALTCVYTADAAHPYLSFPHAFALQLTYTLCERGLQIITEITNHSDENMPCMLGFHTTFSLPFITGGAAEDVLAGAAIAEEYARDKKTFLPTGEKPAFDAVSEAVAAGSWTPADGVPVSRHYRAAGEDMFLIDRRHGLRVTYHNDAAFGYRLLYNGAGDSFVCLEPQTVPVNAPNAPFPAVRRLLPFVRPGETKRFLSEISITEEAE